jgi:ribosomal protein L19E
MAWLADHRSLSAELIEVGGKSLKIEADKTSTKKLIDEAVSAAEAAGLIDIDIHRETNTDGKGRAKKCCADNWHPRFQDSLCYRLH